jgi:hypothetical protein
MKKFMVLYMMPTEAMQEAMKTMTPEEQKAGTEAWNNWMEAHKADLADPGAPLGKNKRITKEGVADTHNDVGGYTIVQADSHDEAVKLVQDSPNLDMPGAYMEVMEVVQM